MRLDLKKTKGLRLVACFVGLSSMLAACNVKKAPTTPSDYAAKDPLVAHERFELRSEHLADLRSVAVYVPPHYHTELARNFPVLYMPDGGVKQDFPHVAHTIDRLIGQGIVPPMLVVGVESQDRYRELTTPANSRRWKKRLPQSGGSAANHAFFEQELKPEIARRFRVQGMPKALIGESLAGRWVVDGWMRHPDRYDVWIAIDPSMWWNHQELLHGMERKLRDAKAHRASRLYMSGAYRDRRGSLPKVSAFVRKLQSLGVAGDAVTFGSYPSLDHAEIFRSTEREIYTQMLSGWNADVRAQPLAMRGVEE